jgi:N-acyl-D-aspartate/D-glutamate deacylase
MKHAAGRLRAASLLVLTLILAGPVHTHAQEPLVAPGDLVLRGGWLFDATGNDVRRNRGIVIRRGKLVAVDRDLSAANLDGATVRTLGDDEYVLPGLFDLHAHYAIDLFGEGRIDEYEVNPVIFLANGVTSTFPAG